MKVPQIKVAPTHSGVPAWAWCAYIDGMEETTTVVGATQEKAIEELVNQMREEYCDGAAPSGIKWSRR